MEPSCEKLAFDRLVADDFTPLELLHYATAPRKIIAEEMDTIFDNVFLAKENNVDELITQVIKLLEDMGEKAEEFDRTKEKKKPRKAQKLGEIFEQAMRKIDVIAKRLLGTKIQLSTEARLYNEHKESIFREYSKLSVYVSNLKNAIETIEKQVSGLRDAAESSKEMFDIEKYKAKEDMLRQMGAKLCDLEKSLLIALQNVCQLNLMAMNNASLCEQMQNVMFEGMSIFKSNIIITIGNREAKAATQMIKSIIEGVKSIKVTLETYKTSIKESKGQKIETPTNLAEIEKEIARLHGMVVIS